MSPLLFQERRARPVWPCSCQTREGPAGHSGEDTTGRNRLVQPLRLLFLGDRQLGGVSGRAFRVVLKAWLLHELPQPQHLGDVMDGVTPSSHHTHSSHRG